MIIPQTCTIRSLFHVPSIVIGLVLQINFIQLAIGQSTIFHSISNVTIGQSLVHLIPISYIPQCYRIGSLYWLYNYKQSIRDSGGRQTDLCCEANGPIFCPNLLITSCTSFGCIALNVIKSI